MYQQVFDVHIVDFKIANIGDFFIHGFLLEATITHCQADKHGTPCLICTFEFFYMYNSSISAKFWHPAVSIAEEEQNKNCF